MSVVGGDGAAGERGGVDAANGFMDVDVDVRFVDNFSIMVLAIQLKSKYGNCAGKAHKEG